MKIKNLILILIVGLFKINLAFEFNKEDLDFDDYSEKHPEKHSDDQDSIPFDRNIYNMPDLTDKEQMLQLLTLVAGKKNIKFIQPHASKKQAKKEELQNKLKTKKFEEIAKLDKQDILKMIDDLIKREALTDLKELLAILEKKSVLNIEMLNQIQEKVQIRKEELKKPIKSQIKIFDGLESEIAIDLNQKIQELILYYLQIHNNKVPSKERQNQETESKIKNETLKLTRTQKKNKKKKEKKKESASIYLENPIKKDVKNALNDIIDDIELKESKERLREKEKEVEKYILNDFSVAQKRLNEILEELKEIEEFVSNKVSFADANYLKEIENLIGKAQQLIDKCLSGIQFMHDVEEIVLEFSKTFYVIKAVRFKIVFKQKKQDIEKLKKYLEKKLELLQ